MPKLPKFKVTFSGVKDGKEQEFTIQIRAPDLFSSIYRARAQAIINGYKYTKLLKREEMEEE